MLLTDPQFFVTPGYGDGLLRDLHYSQAVRVGDRVETSGQGGWDDAFSFPDDLAAEFVQAFDNVARTLAEAGATWADVIHINSYHLAESPEQIGATHNRVMVEQVRARMGHRAPTWTQTGVTTFGAPKMRIEVRVAAFVKDAI